MGFKDERRVIVAASLGTGFEWYAFSPYGSLAGLVAKRLSSGPSEAPQPVFALLAFAVRPSGAPAT